MSDQRWARIGGWAAIGGGVLGAAAAAFLLVVPPVVPDDRFSFPLESTGFATIHTVFFLHHLVLAFALLAYWRAGLAGRSRFAIVAGVVSVGAMLLLAVQELVAISAVEEPAVSPLVDTVSGMYGLVSILLGVGMILLGVATARAHVLSGSGRWVMLVAGVYVFVPLTPAVFAPFAYGRLALGIWQLLFVWVGAGMLGWAGASLVASRSGLQTGRIEGRSLR